MMTSPTAGNAPSSRCPDGTRIYAVGDIHGRDDLLIRMHAMILADARTRPELAPTVVYLGDYVDRGSGSFEVIEFLINEPLPGFTSVTLMGNHEDMMLRFLDGPPTLNWLVNGGIATLASYGVGTADPIVYLADLDVVRRDLRAAVPPAHRRFLLGLDLMHVAGDYVFVHAGVRPGVDLEAQAPADLLWIRDKFLDSRKDHGKVVIHGHTITEEPEIRANRIGIDTGAFVTDRLTCLVLEGCERRFIQT
ncbi:MAG TPA: metallophosphoesterase family protein [Rhodospirillales bacterium]|nr:metallophosphoesterase family protein [Rhodospirillales bacterium]